MAAPRPLPRLDNDNRAFWTGGAEGELRLMRCRDCSEEFHVDLRNSQKVLCPQCRGTRFEYVSGREYEVDSIQIV